MLHNTGWNKEHIHSDVDDKMANCDDNDESRKIMPKKIEQGAAYK